MRVFGLVGLVLALLIVGLLVKKQMGTTIALPAQAASVATPNGSTTLPPVTTPAQARQVEQDIKNQLDAVMQAPRKMPDDN